MICTIFFVNTKNVISLRSCRFPRKNYFRWRKVVLRKLCKYVICKKLFFFLSPDKFIVITRIMEIRVVWSFKEGKHSLHPRIEDNLINLCTHFYCEEATLEALMFVCLLTKLKCSVPLKARNPVVDVVITQRNTTKGSLLLSVCKYFFRYRQYWLVPLLYQEE